MSKAAARKIYYWPKTKFVKMQDARPPRQRRRWLQFTLRSLLVFVALCAVVCSWFAVKLKYARERQVAVAHISECGGRVRYYDPESDKTTLASRLPEPNWLRRSFGDDFFFDVTQVTFGPAPTMGGFSSGYIEVRFGDSDMEYLGRLTNLRRLDLNNTQITSAGLHHLKRLPNLIVLGLGGIQVTDGGLEHLENLTQLRILRISGTEVTDSGLLHIEGLTSLRKLHLERTHVTDAGLIYFKDLAELEVLDLRDTQVTDGGVKALRQMLPNCLIRH